MISRKIRIIDILFWVAVIGSDILVYVILGALLMSYEDRFDDSKGEFWSLASMDTREKIIYISYRGWMVLNAIGIIYIVYRIYKRIKLRK
ncbi:MAG: hypothetical protein Q8M29_19185 [Bacteroidota bacterium]|nr:hypothetical protein [Bacteroidota bacterium]